MNIEHSKVIIFLYEISNYIIFLYESQVLDFKKVEHDFKCCNFQFFYMKQKIERTIIETKHKNPRLKEQ